MTKKDKIKELLEQGYVLTSLGMAYNKDVCTTRLAEYIRLLRGEGMEILDKGRKYSEYYVELKDQREIFV